MSTRMTGLLLAAAGVIVALLGVTADLTGLGRAYGFGIQQIALLVVGLILVVVGLLAARRPR